MILTFLVRVRPGEIAIAAVEDVSRAAPYVARGYAPVSPAAYSMYWRIQHTARMTAMIDAARAGAALLERSVGGWQPSGILACLPDEPPPGWKKYYV